VVGAVDAAVSWVVAEARACAFGYIIVQVFKAVQPWHCWCVSLIIAWCCSRLRVMPAVHSGSADNVKMKHYAALTNYLNGHARQSGRGFLPAIETSLRNSLPEGISGADQLRVTQMLAQQITVEIK
jgi:hypothetical protein